VKPGNGYYTPNLPDAVTEEQLYQKGTVIAPNDEEEISDDKKETLADDKNAITI